MTSKVLVIDDDASTAREVARLLEESGYEATIAHDGPNALVEAPRLKPDVVLLDFVMPGMSGLAVCAELRKAPATRRVPIVMLTAYDEEDSVQRAFAAGADDYIRKPVRKHELVPRLGAHIRSKRLLDELEEQTRDRHLLLELSNALTSQLDLHQILRVVAARLVQSIDVERCSIIMIEPQTEYGWVVVASEDPNVENVRIELKNYPEILEVLQTRAPLVVADAESHPIFSPVKQSIQQKSIRASILFPMILMNEVTGVLLLRSSQPKENLSARALMFGQTVAAATAVAVRNARLFSGIAEEQVRLDVERREASERLESVRRFEDFIAGAADGIITLDQSGIVTFANRAASELLSIRHGDALRIDFMAMLHDEHERERFRTQLANKAVEAAFDVRLVVRGQGRIMSGSISSFQHRHGATLFTFRDVTKERTNEIELEKTKFFLENLIHSSVDPILAWAPEGEVILINRSAEAVFGYAAKDSLGRLTTADLFGKEGALEVMRDLRSPERGGVGKLELSRHEVIAQSGERVPVNFTAALVYEDGKEVAAFGIFSDLRERLRIESKLSAAQEKLQLNEKQAVIAELAGTAAHELNQPLTSIIGYAEMLKRKIEESNPLRRPVDVILTEAERMANIVRKIGRITKYETKAYVGSTRIVDLDASAATEEGPPK